MEAEEFETISLDELEALFDEWVVGHGERVADFIEAFVATGGDRDTLDLSLASLDPAVLWFVGRTHSDVDRSALPPLPDTVMRWASPYWLPRRDAEWSALASLAASYVGEVYMREAPGAAWWMERDRGMGFYGKPQLGPQPLAITVAGVPLSAPASDRLRGRSMIERLERWTNKYEEWSGRPVAAPPDGPKPEVMVDEDGGWLGVTIDERTDPERLVRFHDLLEERFGSPEYADALTFDIQLDDVSGVREVVAELWTRSS